MVGNDAHASLADWVFGSCVDLPHRIVSVLQVPYPGQTAIKSHHSPSSSETSTTAAHTPRRQPPSWTPSLPRPAHRPSLFLSLCCLADLVSAPLGC
jgi:hypothetical protein